MQSAVQDLPRWTTVAVVLAPLLGVLLALALVRLRRVAALEREVSELRRLQVRREQDAARLRFFFEHSRDAVFVIDGDARVVEANDSFARMIGRPLAEVPALHIWDFDIDYPRERAIESVARTSPELQTFESRWRGPGGTVVHVGISINRVVFQGRRLILGVARDIGERKRIEAELLQHRGRLEEAVAGRTRELAQAVRAHADSELRLQALNEQLMIARDRAEAASRAKSAFLANMSHEIRTPMNAIIGLTHLMQREARSAADGERLAKVAEAAHHLLEVINDVLDLSKIESGKLMLERTGFELEPLLARCIALVAERARAKGLTLTVSAIDVPAVLEGDPTRLSQAILNLLSNAVKFTDAGSVRLQCELDERVAPGQGDAASGPARVKLRFTVHDTGMGVPEPLRPMLFNAFEQGDSSTTRRFGGTGLGLAITRRLAQLMEGEVGVDSEVGVGSRFWFSAWFAEVGEAAGAAASPRAVPSAGRPDFSGVRVLVAEDNLINQEVAVELLRAAGMVVEVANDGRAAVQRAMAAAYDLVLMDVQMPVLDGLEATRQLRELPQHAATPIIAMTANAFGDDRDACLAAGMNDHIGKPVDPMRLYAAIGLWLRRSPELAAPAAAPTAAPAVHRATAAPVAEPLPPIRGLTATRALTYLPGRDDIYRRVLRRFADGQAADPPPLRALARSADWAGLRRAAHALRGSCGAIGAVDLGGLALALEQAIEAGEDDAVRVLRADTLDAALRTLVADIAAALAADAVGAAGDGARHQ